MKKHSIKLAALAAIAFCSVATVQAAPITYDFTVSNFVSQSGGNPVPNTNLSGSFTLDGNVVTGVDLTIGSHTYTTSEVGSDGTSITGGLTCGINCIPWGTNDFWITGNFATLTFFNMYYSVSGVNDIFYSSNGALSIGQPTGVPEPSTLILLAAGILGLGFTRRLARK